MIEGWNELLPDTEDEKVAVPDPLEGADDTSDTEVITSAAREETPEPADAVRAEIDRLVEMCGRGLSVGLEELQGLQRLAKG